MKDCFLYLFPCVRAPALIVWHKIFAGVYFCGLAIFCFAGFFVLRLEQIGFSYLELIFAIFRNFPVHTIDNIFVFIEYVQ